MSSRALIAVLAFAAVLFAVQVSVEAAPIPVIIDCDLNSDDMLALAYVIAKVEQNPTEYKLIYVAGLGGGWNTFKEGSFTFLRLLKFMNESQIGYGEGAPTATTYLGRRAEALIPNPPFKAFKTSTRMIANLSFINPPALKPPYPVKDAYNAIDRMALLLLQAKTPVRIISLGGFTNLAYLLATYPTIASKIETVWVMGGAVYVPGNLYISCFFWYNCTKDNLVNTKAEWNIWLDPKAASFVFKMLFRKIYLIPLDVTDQVPFTNEFYNQMIPFKRVGKPAIKVWYEIMTHIKGNEGADLEFYYFWDPTAAVAALEEDPAMFEYRTIRILVDDKDYNGAWNDETGRTKPDPAGVPVKVAIKVNPTLMKAELLKVLTYGRAIYVPPV